MEQRIVKLQIRDEFISGAGVSVGAVGSHDDVLLEMDFRNSALWTDTSRRAIFHNALGENPTTIILTADLLEEGQDDVYLVPVPGEAKDVAGECFLTVEGWAVEEDIEILRVVTQEVTFRVMPSKLYRGETSVTPGELEQIQAEVDYIKENVVKTVSSVEASEQNALDAEAWAVGQRGGEVVTEEDETHQNNAKWFAEQAETAKTSAETAREETNEKAAIASAAAVLSESWAVGGTGEREGENTNNAKYWAEVAASIAATGGVASFNGRTGVVTPQAGDYTAEMVGAATEIRVQEIVAAAIGSAIGGSY